MKKIVILFLISGITLISYSQISGFRTNSQKSYQDNKTTVYLELEGHLKTELLEGISENLNSHPDIDLFAFIDPTNPKKCMFTSNSDFTSDNLVDVINDFIREFVEFDNDTDLSNTFYFDMHKSTKFELNRTLDETEKAQLITEVSNQDYVISFEINDENICKLTYFKTTSGNTIRSLFSLFNLEIIEIQRN